MPEQPVGQLLIHMSHVKTSPKWSLGGRKDRENGMETPGPGTYGEVTTHSFKGSRPPAFGFGTGKPSRAHRWASAPGPGQYTPVKNTMRNTPLWGFGTPRRERANEADTPGPGAYTHSSGAQGPKHSMASRREGSSRAAGPGPGSYESDDQLSRSAPKYGFGSSGRSWSVNGAVPGPGTYGAERRGSAPMHSMTPRREPRASAGVPGPGTYRQDQLTSSKVPSSPRWGFGKVSRVGDKETNPGPGAYGPDAMAVKSTQPRYSMGGSRKTGGNKFDTPGPGQYAVAGSSQTPRWVFGTDSRDRERHQDMPGPGSYAPEGCRTDAPQYTMVPRRDADLKETNPGPGAYRPKDERPDARAAPQWGLNTSGRKENARMQSPGPGTYQVNTHVGEGPSYSVKGRHTADPNTGGNIGGQYTQFGY